MSAVTAASGPSRSVAGVRLPEPSKWLAEAVRDARNPHPDVGYRGNLRPGVADEARRHLDVLKRALAVATADDWRRFLQPLAVLPNGPESAAALSAQIHLFAMALNTTPAAVLNVDRQREALQQFRYWPLPADISALLSPHVRTLLAEKAALERIVDCADRPAAGPADEADRERIRAGLADLAAELSGRSATARGAALKPDRPRYLSDGALLAAYEQMVAEGGPNAAAAAVRVQALRAKMGDE